MFTGMSFVNLGKRVTFDQMLRYVDTLPNPHVPSYMEIDLRLAWRPVDDLEIALTGQNLIHPRHREFGGGPSRREVQRGVYGKVTWQF
jgi:iron complex outermembrane receptor protein